MNYEPKQLNFDKDILDINNVKLIGCGGKHNIIVTKDNNLILFLTVFKFKSHFNE